MHMHVLPVADLGFLKGGFQGSERLLNLPKKRSSLLRNSEHAPNFFLEKGHHFS